MTDKNNTTLYVSVPKKLRSKLQELSKETGLTMTGIVRAYLIEKLLNKEVREAR